MSRLLAVIFGFMLYSRLVEVLYAEVYPYIYKATIILGIIMPEKHRYLYTVPRQEVLTFSDIVLFYLSPVIICLLVWAVYKMYFKLLKLAKENLEQKKTIVAAIHVIAVIGLAIAHYYASGVAPPL